LVMIAWFSFSYLGATVGTLMPANIPLDFALPIAFLSMIAPMIRSLPHLAAATTAIVVSLLCIAVPYSLGLIIAGIAGMAAGSVTEVRMAKKAEVLQ
jgi:predicted branched-subunit amino acid permease